MGHGGTTRWGAEGALLGDVLPQNNAPCAGLPSWHVPGSTGTAPGQEMRPGCSALQSGPGTAGSLPAGVVPNCAELGITPVRPSRQAQDTWHGAVVISAMEKLEPEYGQHKGKTSHGAASQPQCLLQVQKAAPCQSAG